jgi:hypothetical protein
MTALMRQHIARLLRRAANRLDKPDTKVTIHLGHVVIDGRQAARASVMGRRHGH